MAKEIKIPVTFNQQEIVSAQRMRFLNSSKLRILLIIWLAAVALSVLQSLFPNLLPLGGIFNLTLALQFSGVFTFILIAFYFIAPWLEYRNNALWKTPFVLGLTPEAMRLAMEGRPKGVTIEWGRIRKLNENDLVYILYTSSEDNFLIIPKSAFPSQSAEAEFRQLLLAHSGLPEKTKARL